MRSLASPDEVLLRRFGLVRSVGGAAYTLVVAVLFLRFGRDVWPLALGVPVLAVVTTAYFVRSARYPRLSVVASLVADALVLGGAVAYLGGTGSGLVLLYTIVVVSAGILLGPAAAAGFTALTVALGLLQLVLEQLGYPPVLLHRPDLSDRLPVFLVSVAGLVSVGYLSATYASRLHELVAEAGERFEDARRRGRRRRSFLEHAAVDAQERLAELEQLADELQSAAPLTEEERRRAAARLRMGVTLLDAELGELADVGSLGEQEERRPEVVGLPRVVDDCLVALGARLQGYRVEREVPPIKVVGNRRALRRIVLNLLENVVEHTPPGTTVLIRARSSGGAAVLAVADDGPGVPPQAARGLFAPPEGSAARVGLPLVAELAAAMQAEVRHEPAPGGGARFLVKLRAAPAAAPTVDDDSAAPVTVPPE